MIVIGLKKVGKGIQRGFRTVRRGLQPVQRYPKSFLEVFTRSGEVFRRFKEVPGSLWPIVLWGHRRFVEVSRKIPRLSGEVQRGPRRFVKRMSPDGPKRSSVSPEISPDFPLKSLDGRVGSQTAGKGFQTIRVSLQRGLQTAHGDLKSVRRCLRRFVVVWRWLAEVFKS